jgi:hypothetical protein
VQICAVLQHADFQKSEDMPLVIGEKFFTELCRSALQKKTCVKKLKKNCENSQRKSAKKVEKKTAKIVKRKSAKIIKKKSAKIVKRKSRENN